eukprot:TRINITY_DN75543_c0_g1_i1.p1 TRINITY_DN75543_c0_g1~~TRINITY_DN75543_c0_g1_i1.p1  ORF type:complete len:226 (-),score=61.33 TRINITY_DN75543_c0_g1_i1:330-1007(-)
MAQAELQAKLQRRRMLQEEGDNDGLSFEKCAAPSGADAASSNDGGYTTAAVASDSLPPWLSMASDMGLHFTDSQGQACQTPVPQVSKEEEAFQAALAKIRDFEESLQARRSCKGSSEAVAGGASTTGEEPDAPAEDPSRREGVMMSVKERYFALLAEGLEPNAAAARAILEATGQLGIAQGNEGAATAAPSKEAAVSSTSPRSSCSKEGERRSCASSDKAIAVAA